MLTKRWGGPVGDIDVVLKRGLLIAFFEATARNRLQVAVEDILPHTRSAGLLHLWKPDLQPTPNMRDTTCVPMRVLVTPDGMPHHTFRPSKSRLKDRSRA